MKKNNNPYLLTLPGIEDNIKMHINVKVESQLNAKIISFDREKRKKEDRLLYEKIKIYLSENDVF